MRLKGQHSVNPWVLLPEQCRLILADLAYFAPHLMFSF